MTKCSTLSPHGIATVTLNRPQRLNTISREMLSQLSELFLKADADPEVRVVILTATGRAFCAGLDMASATKGTGIGSANDANNSRTTLDLKTAPPIVMFNMEKPTICAMNGAAAGYGMDVALGCDMRIMAESAKFAAAFVKRGVVPESGGTWFLPRMIGWAKAAELIFTGRTLSARESLEMGLTNEVVDDAELMTRANARGGRDCRQCAARSAGCQTHDALRSVRELWRPRPSRVPAIAAAVSHSGFPRRHGVVS